MPRRKIPKSWRNITNRQFIFGDFDRDTVPNVDDERPFDPKRKRQVEEIRLVDELRAIEKYNRTFRGPTLEVERRERARKNGKVKVTSRIKGPRSTINKLRRKYIHNLQDIGGVRILVSKSEQVHKRAKAIKRSYPILAEDNYYLQPKEGYYFARHLVVKQKSKPVELQIKTFGHHQLHEKIHLGYKMEKKMDAKKLQALARKINLSER